MSTAFSSVPTIDCAALYKPDASDAELDLLARQLANAFRDVGFAYIVNAPLSFSHEDVFSIAKAFFAMDNPDKLKVAKKSFQRQNKNTYRGFFPVQPGADNLKEGFEMGPPEAIPTSKNPSSTSFTLTEPNVFPPDSVFPYRSRIESLYDELMSLSGSLLKVLATSLGIPLHSFSSLLRNSVSTLRLLHYPIVLASTPLTDVQAFNCTPHTDSGLLTLLHQDDTGGLEVRNKSGDWIAAPYVPNSIVVNIGDLLATLSGGEFVATVHRVRASPGKERFSVPFFCEPGVDAIVPVPETAKGKIRYEELVLKKMSTWTEFQGSTQQDREMTEKCYKPRQEGTAA